MLPGMNSEVFPLILIIRSWKMDHTITSAMTVASVLRQETDRQAEYELSVSFRHQSHTLRFFVTPEGALGFDNRQSNARTCAKRQISLALAAEMASVARERVPGALRGRTQRGLAFELRVHNIAYRLGLFRTRSVTTEMGSPFADAPDYDHNAAWFEHPVRSLPGIIKALLVTR